MDKLSEIYQAIDQLNRDEFRKLRAYIEQRVEQPVIANEDPQTKIAALRDAFAKIREGMSQEELDEMIWAMNYEYIEPLSKSDWFNTDNGS